MFHPSFRCKIDVPRTTSGGGRQQPTSLSRSEDQLLGAEQQKGLENPEEEAVLLGNAWVIEKDLPHGDV